MSHNANLRAALAYAKELGWAVFPLKPGEKTPLTEHGFKEASASPEQITAWWTQHPTANVGIATGEVSGIVVVDVDGPQGEEALAALGPLPACPTSSTGKGRHLFFQRPAGGLRNSAGKLGPQLDIRGDGGYIVAPPSVHPSGAKYEWAEELHPLRVTLPELPNAIVALLTDPHLSPRRESDRDANDALSEWIPEGQRNDTLTRRAGELLAKGHGEFETRDYICGLNLLKCRHPLPPDEVESIVRSIVATDRRNRRKPNGAPEQADPLKPRQAPVALFEYLKRPELLQPPPAFVRRLCYEGRVTLFSANHKAGKSTLTGQACAALTRGGEFLGDTIREPQRVLWYAIDEPIGDAVRRFMEYDAEPSQLFLVEEPPTAENMRADITATGARVVVVDTLIELFRGVDENSASELAPRMRPYIDVSRAAGVSLVFLHHTGRSGLDYRGSGHLGAAVDIIVTMQVIGAGAPAAPNAGDDPTVEDVRRILKGKGRGGIHFHERLTYTEGRYVLGEPAPSLLMRVLRALLVEPASMSKLATDLKVRKEAITDLMPELLRECLVRQTGSGKAQRCELTDVGKMRALEVVAVPVAVPDPSQKTTSGTASDPPAIAWEPQGTGQEPYGNRSGTARGVLGAVAVPEKNPRGFEREPKGSLPSESAIQFTIP